MEYILCGTADQYIQYELTEKENRDIERDLNKMIKNLSSNDYSHFIGEELIKLDDETREAIINSLKSSLIMARQLAKEKFTPNKYKKRIEKINALK